MRQKDASQAITREMVRSLFRRIITLNLFKFIPNSRPGSKYPSCSVNGVQTYTVLPKMIKNCPVFPHKKVSQMRR